jgi:hypothetical protein
LVLVGKTVTITPASGVRDIMHNVMTNAAIDVSDSAKKISRGDGHRTTRPYVLLNEAMKRSLKRMQVKRGSFYEALQALLCAAFIVEAYLNTLGEKLHDDWHSKQKSGQPKERQTILEKVKLVQDRLKDEAIDHAVKVDESLYRELEKLCPSLSRVKAFRDMVVHSREETKSGEVLFIDDLEIRGLETDWEKLLDDHDLVEALCKDCISLVKVLNQICRESGRTDIARFSNPFMAGSSTTAWVREDAV